MTDVVADDGVPARLDELGLTADVLSRVLERADAEATATTELDPPTIEGILRYGKAVRFLREELVPQGWTFSNARNYCTTVHPDGALAIVPSSGDEYTGVWVPGQSPTTKYPKGETTARVVRMNGQGVLDLDLGEALEEPAVWAPESVWYLLYRVADGRIFLELSFPTAIDGGVISSWRERIILPPIDRQPLPYIDESWSGPSDDSDDDRYDVSVAPR